jgi:tetratricopeptide (TPR) repeat protein
MNEVPDLTAKLSMLPSSGLQQFAQLHKSDPYIMALVMSESNRRKKLQQAGQQSQGEAPKVVDQMISSLALPEDRGIAQLPAPNMANMADGGIAGYSDDEEGYAAGGVPGYADKGAVEEELPRGVFRVGDKLMYMGVDKKPHEYTPEAQKPGLLDTAKSAWAFANRNANNFPTSIAAPPAPPAPPGAPTFQTPNQQGFMPGGSTPPPVAPPPAPDNIPADRPPAAPTAPRVAPTSVPLPEAMTPQQSMDAAQQFVKPGADQLKADLLARQDRVKQENEQNLADYQKGLGALPEAYKGYEERLKAQEASAGQEKEDAKGMAIFKAGLAIMAGSSPNALQNIGKGAMVGAEDYQGALKDFKKAALERDKAFADIENARLAYKRDDMKTYQALKERGQDRLAHVDDKLGDIAAKMFDTTSTIGASIYANGIKDLHDAQREQARLQSGERIANAANATHLQAAGMNNPLNLYRELGANPTGAVAKGYGAAKEEATVPQLFALYEKMASDQTPTMGGKYTTKGEEFAAKHKTPQSFIQSYRAAMGQGTMSGTGQNWGTAVEIPPK